MLSRISNFKKISDRIKKNKGIISKKEMEHFLPQAPIIVEAGAHIGLDTIEISHQWPKATIHAFEPMPEIFEKLKNNTANLSNVILHPCALSSITGSAKFYVSSGISDGSSSLLAPKRHLVDHPDVLFTREVDVPTITLDNWAKKNHIPRVDFLWLDTQGTEPLILKASPIILSTVQLIYTEVSLVETYNGVVKYPEFREWLESQGFEVVKEALPWLDGGNVLFRQNNKN
ncbi:MAG: FkbM family methyltransferase [Deltaproteobacteria bacterium]|nr:FkbM family methyltransferase [Deltaproteobacteria bacterium]